MRHNRMTVADLRALKGRRQMTMLYVETPEEARAAAAAGIDILSIIDPLWTPAMREAAGDCFVQVGLLYGELVTTGDYLRAAHRAMRIGGDCVYCAAGLGTIRALADEGVPVVSHVGLIPSKRTWTGGFRAVGKTLEAAQLVWRQVRALEEAGAFAAEIEVVPHAITRAIAERTSLFLISMGAGSAGHAQYLFSDDVLGQNRGHVPRHAKVYASLAAEQDRLQAIRTDAMRRFTAEVHEGLYPAPQHLVDSEPEVVAAFRDWLDGEAS